MRKYRTQFEHVTAHCRFISLFVEAKCAVKFPYSMNLSNAFCAVTKECAFMCNMLIKH
jgi:hypothetical protein